MIALTEPSFPGVCSMCRMYKYVKEDVYGGEVRTDYWGYAAGEKLSADDLLKVKYQVCWGVGWLWYVTHCS